MKYSVGIAAACCMVGPLLLQSELLAVGISMGTKWLCGDVVESVRFNLC